MIALMLAAVLTSDQILKEFDTFCIKAEIEISHPITQKMVTKRSRRLREGELLTVINDRYSMDYYGGRVRYFDDQKESGLRKLNRLDPDEMQRWSEQPCLIDEAGATKIAKRLFARLGFDEKQFDPIELGRYGWQPSEAAPEHILRPPLFWVKWWREGAVRDDALAPCVEMDISGTTKKLVHYSDRTRDNMPLAGLMDTVERLINKHEAAEVKASARDATATIEQFFKTTGVHPPADWKQRAKVWDSSPYTIVQVQDCFLFKLQGRSVHEFWDERQNFRMLVGEQRSAELTNWIGTPTVITETQAVEIATHLLSQLGFDARNLEMTKVDRVELRVPDPEHPAAMSALPTSYVIRWVSKRPFWARSGMPDIVDTEIFGANSNLVSYWCEPNSFRLWP